MNPAGIGFDRNDMFLLSDDKLCEYSWAEDFPPIYNHTSISYLKRCPGFDEAKHGNIQAAMLVTGISVKPRRLNELRERYPSAVLLPVRGQNKLPEALARMIGLKINLDVREVQSAIRKHLSAMERLLHKPQFCGLIHKGENYVLVDDIITQGGTVSALRQYVLSEGGSVAAIAALAYSAGSGVIAPNPERIHQLVDKLQYSCITSVIRSYRIANSLCEMTNSQIKYLSRFNYIERLITKIEKCLQHIC